MSFDYVRKTYGVPAARGVRVLYGERRGVITSATHYVHVRLDGEKFSRPYHPTDLRYLPVASQSQEGET